MNNLTNAAPGLGFRGKSEFWRTAEAQRWGEGGYNTNCRGKANEPKNLAGATRIPRPNAANKERKNEADTYGCPPKRRTELGP